VTQNAGLCRPRSCRPRYTGRSKSISRSFFVIYVVRSSASNKPGVRACAGRGDGDVSHSEIKGNFSLVKSCRFAYKGLAPHRDVRCVHRTHRCVLARRVPPIALRASFFVRDALSGPAFRDAAVCAGCAGTGMESGMGDWGSGIVCLRIDRSDVVGNQHVADAAYRADQPWPAWIGFQLLA